MQHVATLLFAPYSCKLVVGMDHHHSHDGSDQDMHTLADLLKETTNI